MQRQREVSRRGKNRDWGRNSRQCEFLLPCWLWYNWHVSIVGRVVWLLPLMSLPLAMVTATFPYREKSQLLLKCPKWQHLTSALFPLGLDTWPNNAYSKETGDSHLQKQRVHRYITSVNRPRVKRNPPNHTHLWDTFLQDTLPWDSLLRSPPMGYSQHPPTPSPIPIHPLPIPTTYTHCRYLLPTQTTYNVKLSFRGIS